MKTLSNKAETKEEYYMGDVVDEYNVYSEKDVKEFIKELKFELDKQAYSNYDMDLLEIKATINELAGDKLI